jgi:hypothetical protein
MNLLAEFEMLRMVWTSLSRVPRCADGGATQLVLPHF